MRNRSQRGFTLLEVLVATVILAVAVSALLSNLSVSTANLFRSNDMDRLTYLAKRKMDELSTSRGLPRNTPIEGSFPSNDPKIPAGGWRAVLVPFGVPSQTSQEHLERVRLESWLQVGTKRRTLVLETYRSVAGY
ncbi:type IV pilus modification PilV family protein [Bryobacter aggregatus]|uniref:type IV pilus modification PilV family protein n=1 Tax=Bryobacter aggregatus TaxID=360054 RepID=UPI0004E281A7|nr:type II secretion system protein [Bryobacter aggregatus]